jgi:hypothetical protein
MHKSNIVREKLLAKDANLSTLLIESALQKSNNSLKELLEEDVVHRSEDDPLLMGGDDEDQRNTEVLIRSSSDVHPRVANEVRDSDIFIPGGRIDSKSFLLGSPHSSARILLDSRQMLQDDKTLIQGVMRSSVCSEVLKPYR